MEYLLTFALAVFVASFTPGPNNSMLLRSGMIFGLRRTAPHILGILVGFGILFQSVHLGLFRLFGLYPQLLLVLRLAGSLYFSYIAWNMLRRGIGGDYRSQTAQPVQASAALGTASVQAEQPFCFWQGALFQWVNIKGWFFALGVNNSLPVRLSLAEEVCVALILVLFTLASALTWTALGLGLERLFSRALYRRAISAVLALSLLYVVLTWWLPHSV